MQKRSVVFALSMLLSLGAFACGASNAESGAAAKDPWADFKGTYSTPAAPRAEKTADEKKTDAKQAAESKAKAEPKAESSEETPALPPSPASKKSSRGTVKGESLSSVSVETLTDVSKASLPKAKFVSNSTIAGEKYELVQVQLKGATVQITRPTATPTPGGPAISAPKVKNGELSKNDASWYDEDADVLVVVTAGKKAAAQKALGSIVKR